MMEHQHALPITLMILWARHSRSARESSVLLGMPMQATNGTVTWRIKDDNGQIHSILSKDTNFMEKIINRILSPQHFTQASCDHKPMPERMEPTTNSKSMMLF